MYVERAMYSFRISFWTVPRSTARGMPRASAVAMYRASRIAAVALIVMLVLTRSRGRPSRRIRMSSIIGIATPTRPTSPRASGASLSYPIWVGRSNATLKPSLPCDSRYLNRRFVSFAVPNPAYCRIVHRRPRYIVARTPRVNGGSPGNPIRPRNSSAVGSRAGTTTGTRSPLCVRPCATGASAAVEGALAVVRGRLRFTRSATGEGSRGPRIRVPRDSWFEAFEGVGQLRERPDRRVRPGFRDTLRVSVSVQRRDGLRARRVSCEDVHRAVADHGAPVGGHTKGPGGEEGQVRTRLRMCHVVPTDNRVEARLEPDDLKHSPHLVPPPRRHRPDPAIRDTGEGLGHARVEPDPSFDEARKMRVVAVRERLGDRARNPPELVELPRDWLPDRGPQLVLMELGDHVKLRGGLVHRFDDRRERVHQRAVQVEEDRERHGTSGGTNTNPKRGRGSGARRLGPG